MKTLRQTRTWLPSFPTQAVCIALLCTIATLGACCESANAQATPPGFRGFSVQQTPPEQLAPKLQQMLRDSGFNSEVVVDRQNNRVLVSGNEAAWRLAQQWLQVADAQPVATAPTGAGEPKIQGYRVDQAELKAVFDKLQQQFGNRRDVRLSLDERTSQILLFAPPQVHAATEEFIRLWSQTPTTATVDPAAQSYLRRQLFLQHLTWRELEAELQRVWGDKLDFSFGPKGEVLTIRIASSGATELHIDRRVNGVVIEGPANRVKAWERVIVSLDTKDRTTRLTTYKNADPAEIKKAAALLVAQSNGDLKAAPSPQDEARALLPPGKTRSPRWGGDLVSMIFQPADGQPAEGQPAEGQPVPPATEVEQPAVGQPAPGEGGGEAPIGGGDGPRAIPVVVDDDDSGAIGPVRIDFVEGLDVIIVRGNKRDVDRVLKIINEIESLSGETQPAIEIVGLRYANSTALTELLTELYAEILSSRQGAASMRALVKPNAILLIGRRDTVDSLIELIRRLDKPVDPTQMLRVHLLRHMSAADAETRLEELYEEPTGLATRVRVVADYRSNALIVQASPRDQTEIASLIRKIDVAKSKSSNEVRIIKLGNALAEDLAPVLQDAINGQLDQGNAGNAEARSAMLTFMTIDSAGGKLLRSGILFDSRVTADVNSNSLIVTAPADSMPLIEALVKSLDQLPNAEAQIKVFTIVNGDATNLATMLQDLFGESNNQAGPPQAQTAGGETSLVPLRFAVDQRTNSIIVSGGAGDLTVVEAILFRLDEGDIETRRTTVYRLRNAPAADVAQAINDLLSGQREVQNIAADVFSPFQQIEREVIVVPEIVSNSLIVSATPRYFDEIREVVEQLDARPPMVMIQVLIAEVTINETEEFGIELGIQDSLLFDRGLGVVGFPFNQAALGNNADAASLATRQDVGGQALSNLNVGRINGNLGYGGLVLSAGNESLNVLVRALQDRGRMQVLSRPEIMTLDNQPAFVQVGARVPRITGTTTNQNGTTNSVVLEDVGILLGVTPRTSSDGLVVMEIDTEKSALGPEAQGIPIFVDNNGNVIRSPQINITTAQTTISARSGQSVVFGGLITKSKATTRRGTPILSDIPVLGRLFRFDSEQDVRTELVIIMTPYVITDEADIDFIKQMETDRMSWCLADVVEVHGDIGVRGRDCGWETPQMETIYPDESPGYPTGAQPIYADGYEVQPLHQGVEIIPSPAYQEQTYPQESFSTPTPMTTPQPTPQPTPSVLPPGNGPPNNPPASNTPGGNSRTGSGIPTPTPNSLNQTNNRNFSYPPVYSNGQANARNAKVNGGSPSQGIVNRATYRPQTVNRGLPGDVQAETRVSYGTRPNTRPSNNVAPASYQEMSPQREANGYPPARFPPVR